MGVWDIYEERISNSGATKREAILNRTKRSITSKMPDNLSSQEVLINGVPQTIAIIDSDNLNQKKILSLPDEDFDCGDMIEWAGSHWMITEKDANTEVRAKGLLLQCNYLLKWIDENDNIIEQWCYVEDGTKLYLSSFRIGKPVRKNNVLNCWDAVKLFRLQRMDEISQSVNAVERQKELNRWHMVKQKLILIISPKCYIIGNQQPSPEQGKVRRSSSRRRVGI